MAIEQQVQQRSIKTQLANLPFRIRPALTAATISHAAELRQEAYHRHLPKFSDALANPEEADTQEGCALFVAESKLDGTILGSVRVQTNLYAPLPVEKSLVLPRYLTDATLGEAVRLSVVRDRPGSLVRALLCKAYLLFCEENEIEHLVIAARSPLDRQYEKMNFQEIYPERGFINLKHAGDIPHRVMTQPVKGAITRLGLSNSPLFSIFKEKHADFDVSAPVHFKRISNVESGIPNNLAVLSSEIRGKQVSI